MARTKSDLFITSTDGSIRLKRDCYATLAATPVAFIRQNAALIFGRADACDGENVKVLCAMESIVGFDTYSKGKLRVVRRSFARALADLTGAKIESVLGGYDLYLTKRQIAGWSRAYFDKLIRQAAKDSDHKSQGRHLSPETRHSDTPIWFVMHRLSDGDFGMIAAQPHVDGKGDPFISVSMS